jgi:acetamidase/formamidase
VTLTIEAGPKTAHWGYLDAGLEPLAVIESGDAVTISTVSGTPAQMPDSPRFAIPEPLRNIHASTPMVLPGHICTGPVAVRGARPGQVLQVDIEEIRLNQDWGFTGFRPQRGALVHDVTRAEIMHIPLDRDRMKGRLPWGVDIDLKPFFGVMAVAPPAEWGRVSTIQPRTNGGNMDNKELVEGTTLYLPVFVADALFSVGDGHAVQGDGEVCVNAIETGLVGRFRLTLRDDLRLEWPMGETPTHMITMAFDPDLDDCVVIALRQMIALIRERVGLTWGQAYMLCSLAADLRITQVVNDNKGVHMMLQKRFLEPV